LLTTVLWPDGFKNWIAGPVGFGVGDAVLLSEGDDEGLSLGESEGDALDVVCCTAGI
jgi:hypothetical protein